VDRNWSCLTVGFLKIWSAVLIQMEGWQRSFQPLMKVRDLDHQLADRGEDATVDGLAFDDPEPDLDEVEPRP
jgi:hypothetical protein